ncbi:MAG: ThiF family adenylyltransferase [Afipia sp.]|nr:ThiF family adenylyltransferase [Afipia sp.]
MTLRQTLDRTLLLMRDEINETADDETLIVALTGTKVAIIADTSNLATHSAQTAFITMALLMARSAHHVYLLAPDLTLVGVQTPLGGGSIIAELLKIGTDLLPGVAFSTDIPDTIIDLAIALGDSNVPLRARHEVTINADNWCGHLTSPQNATPWNAGQWPLGGMMAAAMAAAEAFKISMRKLEQHARNPGLMAELFAPVGDITFALAPADTKLTCEMEEFDCVSGGAITQSILYVLTRVAGVKAHARVIEPDHADPSNLNRYMLLLHSHLGSQKAEDLAAICSGTGLTIEPVAKRYEPAEVDNIKLRPDVLVGVDDIPSRWLVQRSRPRWLAIGATTHWSAMASFHVAGIGGCAECLHPEDDPSNAPIPTVAFVSFWAGLLTAAYFLRQKSGQPLDNFAAEQQIYVTPTRPENPVWAFVTPHADCTSCASLLDVTTVDRPPNSHSDRDN